MDVYAENLYRTHFLHLHFVTIASIIFENTNADVDSKGLFTASESSSESEKDQRKKCKNQSNFSLSLRFLLGVNSPLRNLFYIYFAMKKSEQSKQRQLVIGSSL